MCAHRQLNRPLMRLPERIPFFVAHPTYPFTSTPIALANCRNMAQSYCASQDECHLLRMAADSAANAQSSGTATGCEIRVVGG